MDTVFLSTWFLFVHPQYQPHCSAEVLNFLMELSLPHQELPRACPEGSQGGQFSSSSFVFSLKRESEVNPRSIFSLGPQPLTKLCQKVMGCFLQGAQNNPISREFYQKKTKSALLCYSESYLVHRSCLLVITGVSDCSGLFVVFFQKTFLCSTISI